MTGAARNMKTEALPCFHPPVPTRVDARPADLLTDLPPGGHSPAGDLQRKLAQAALHGFYAPRESRPWGIRRRLAIMFLASILGWGMVFGTWVALAQISS